MESKNITDLTEKGKELVGICAEGLKKLWELQHDITDNMAQLKKLAAEPPMPLFSRLPPIKMLPVDDDQIVKENTMETKNEQVNHPSHYGGDDNVYETVKVIEAWKLGFNLGSAVKYISRAGKKDPKKLREDLEKAQWFLQREIGKDDLSLCGIDEKFILRHFGKEYRPMACVHTTQWVYQTVGPMHHVQCALCKTVIAAGVRYEPAVKTEKETGNHIFQRPPTSFGVDSICVNCGETSAY